MSTWENASANTMTFEYVNGHLGITCYVSVCGTCKEPRATTPTREMQTIGNCQQRIHKCNSCRNHFVQDMYNEHDFDRLIAPTFSYHETDDESASIEGMTFNEVKEFIRNHNRDFQTDYHTIQEFNDGEARANGIRRIEIQ